VIEDLDFAEARSTGREHTPRRPSRGRRGRRFRGLVAGIPPHASAGASRRCANQGLTVIAVDAAYTSRWGLQHWFAALKQASSEASTHHAAALVIGRRGLAQRARRRLVVTRPTRGWARESCQLHRVAQAGPCSRPERVSHLAQHPGCLRLGVSGSVVPAQAGCKVRLSHTVELAALSCPSSGGVESHLARRRARWASPRLPMTRAAACGCWPRRKLVSVLRTSAADPTGSVGRIDGDDGSAPGWRPSCERRRRKRAVGCLPRAHGTCVPACPSRGVVACAFPTGGCVPRRSQGPRSPGRRRPDALAMWSSCEIAWRTCPVTVVVGRPEDLKRIVMGPRSGLPEASTTIAASQPAFTSTARTGLSRRSSRLGGVVTASFHEASRYQRPLSGSKVMSLADGAGCGLGRPPRPRDARRPQARKGGSGHAAVCEMSEGGGQA